MLIMWGQIGDNRESCNV